MKKLYVIKQEESISFVHEIGDRKSPLALKCHFPSQTAYSSYEGRIVLVPKD